VHPDEQFFIGCDVGIYWVYVNPVLDGCKAPDWFYVPNVPPMLDGKIRRSYVLWKEPVKPVILIEYVSGDGSAERDTTPYKGKFWVYEQAINASYYVIFDPWRSTLEVYRLVNGRYQLLPANAAGRFPIEPMGIELGIWEGSYRTITGPWLRVWDAETGEMILLSEERAEAAEAIIDETRQLLTEETERAEAERKRAEDEKRRADEVQTTLTDTQQRLQIMAEKLRALGLDPEG
jgi:Uma2 family endonuclease